MNTKTPPASSTAPPTSQRRKQLSGWLLGLIVIFVLVVILGYWWFVTHELLPDRTLTRQQIPVALATGTNPPAGQPGTQTESDLGGANRGAAAGSFWAQWATRDNDLATYRGTFGDMFGAVNALFSALAFAGVLYALMLQRQDLRQQSDAVTRTQLVAIDAAKLQGHATLATAVLETIKLARDAKQEPSSELDASLKSALDASLKSALDASLKSNVEQIQTLLRKLREREEEEERARKDAGA